MEQKFSLFQIEKPYYGLSSYVGDFKTVCIISCFEYINTYDTLEEAKIAQKEYKQKTLILPSY